MNRPVTLIHPRVVSLHNGLVSLYQPHVQQNRNGKNQIGGDQIQDGMLVAIHRRKTPLVINPMALSQTLLHPTRMEQGLLESE